MSSMMFLFSLSLLLAGISRSTEEVLTFTQEPASTVYFMEGSDAVIRWDYKVENRSLFNFITWEALNKVTKYFDGLIAQYENGNIQLNPALPQQYQGRIQKLGNATLVIKNATFEDSTSIKCILKGTVGNIHDKQSLIELVVTGQASVYPTAKFAALGDSVTFTCNATGVPSQNYTWRKQQQEQTVGFGPELTIKNIDVADRDYYVCDATVNPNQQNTAYGYLEVENASPFKENYKSCPTMSYAVQNGDQLSICCPVSGYPPPVVTWKTNGAQLQQGEGILYTISSVEDKDLGNYTCTATNFKTTIGPLAINVLKKRDQLDVDVTDGKVGTPGELRWEAVRDAEYYVVTVTGNDALADYFLGKKTSMEFYYHTFQPVKGEKMPKEIKICAEVIAINNVEQVIAKTPECKELTLKSNQEPLKPSVVSLLLLLIASWYM